MKYVKEIQEMVYLEYLDIPKNAYQHKIRYFERHEKAIKQLPESIFFQIRLDYILALFEVKEYYQFLFNVDLLIERIIEDNIKEINGEDIYKGLLYRKAVAAHYTIDFKTSEHVLSELIKMGCSDKRIKKAYLRNTTEDLRYHGQVIRSIIILLFLLAGIVIALELLIVRSIFVEQTIWVEMLRNGLFFTALILFVSNELKIRVKARGTYNKLSKSKYGHVIY